ncbi:hypothetical protein PF023_03015 [Enterococcus thailandicus]|uniref:hypothetical protein n=1 Tax=Enterococcus thailandicus TaxID=417368 RepID=UPI0022EBC9C3|nr:hypothetical protein [Enterococcus thailandicus]MDA3973005.1 hypothetical protein [Enterococcus thailandicus]MDA3975561.1 hypothetical protein [Enterococcus thailandicus]MDA3980465.1 hypothetical protein [Enterococcus thailandicus]
MLEIKEILRNHENAQIVDIYFSKNNVTFFRTLIGEANEDIYSILEYLEDSIEEIEIQTFCCGKIMSIVNQSKLNSPSGNIRLEEFWGDVTCYIIEYVDSQTNIDGFLIVGDVEYEPNELENILKKYINDITIKKIEVFRDSWIKRR